MERTVRRVAAVVLLVAGTVACSGDDDAALPASAPPTIAASAPVQPDLAASSTASPTVEAAPAAGRYPAQPDGVPYPTSDWPTGPLPTGVDQAAIDAAVDAAFGPAGAEARVRSVVVVQGGRLLYERYHERDGADVVMSSYSVAKSFTSAIIGQLVGDGALRLDQDQLRPEWPAGDERSRITVRDLLQMSSGLAWTEDASVVATAARWLDAPSAAALVAQLPLATPPGTEFNYSTATSALLAGIAADALGGCGALDAHLHARLLDPLGITTEQITTDGGGCFIGGFGMDMTTRDFAKFGLLYVRGGVWEDGRQLLPTGWVDETRVPAATNDAYGLHWWLAPSGDGFSAEGLFRQRIVVVPALDLVIATNSTNGGAPDPIVDEIIAQFTADG